MAREEHELGREPLDIGVDVRERTGRRVRGLHLGIETDLRELRLHVVDGLDARERRLLAERRDRGVLGLAGVEDRADVALDVRRVDRRSHRGRAVGHGWRKGGALGRRAARDDDAHDESGEGDAAPHSTNPTWRIWSSMRTCRPGS